MLPSGFRDDRCGRWLNSSLFSSYALERGQMRQDIPLSHSRLSIHNHPEVSLAPFYGLLPILKSIRLASNLFQNSQISGLLHSSLLEDLSSSGRTIGKEDPDPDEPSYNFRPRPHLPVLSASSYSERWKCPGYGPGALAPLRNSRLSVAHSVRSSGFCVGIGSTTLPLFTGDSGRFD